jgi:hypothetical protein
MNLNLLRFSSQREDSLGILMATDAFWNFMCFTLEDEYRIKKVAGETRIPSGTYAIRLRKHGGFHSRYSARFPNIHQGMLELIDVPGFTDILIHCGNRDEDTAGCILVGDAVSENVTEDGTLMRSVAAYRRIYPAIANSLKNSPVYMSIVDYDDPEKEVS